MRRGFCWTAALAGFLLAVAGFTSQSLADPKPPMIADPGLITTESPIAGPSVPAALLLSSDFEASEGFVLGPLGTQNGYSATGGNLPWVSVADLNPLSGAWHMAMAKNLAAGSATLHVCLTPSVGTLANVPSTTRQYVYITNSGGADYDFVGQAPSQGFLSWRVRFNYLGNIFILDDPGGGLQFVDTGVQWITGSYRELKVEFDPAGSQIRYYYDGAPIYTGNVIYAGTAVEQIVWTHDNFQLSSSEHCDVDGLVLTDSPTGPTAAKSTSWGRLKTVYR